MGHKGSQPASRGCHTAASLGHGGRKAEVHRASSDGFPGPVVTALERTVLITECPPGSVFAMYYPVGTISILWCAKAGSQRTKGKELLDKTTGSPREGGSYSRTARRRLEPSGSRVRHLQQGTYLSLAALVQQVAPPPPPRFLTPSAPPPP